MDKVNKHIKFDPESYKPIEEHLKETGLTFTGFVKTLIRKELKQSVS